MPVLQLNSIRDTTLWKRLHNGFLGPEGELAQTFALNLVSICQEAYDRMKAFPSLHHEYTLHDEVHLLRVTELMSMIIPKEVADRLNPVEIFLLILAAHFHDQGMVLEPSEIVALSSDPQFNLFRDDWAISHPNLQDVERTMRDGALSNSEKARCREIEQELKGALLTDYIRQTHGERSANLVRAEYVKDRRWDIGGSNVAELVARLCRSHVLPAHDLDVTHGFRYDEVVSSYRVNMVYLGLILRLADILDLDRDRTPDSLYRSIHFKSFVSLREWAKHRSVEGWLIQSDFIQFTMRCEHPEYQRAAYHFMDWIDHELADGQAACRVFPASVAQYSLNLPLSVDRSRIEPKDGAYIYSDLEFSLSRDEIVKLLMADKLYGRPWICVRELLQNALDALRTRRAVIRRDIGAGWSDGSIEVIHELDSDGYEVLKCIDNGIGMDRNVVERFLTRAGRSYYRSPEFEMERASFRASGFDFDPCAQFGIGFMSCFMLGDRIRIHTRKDYGPRRGTGEPLIVEINGLSGIVVLRQGPDSQPVGTTVEVIGRRKPSFLTKYEDKVRLLAALDGYALATEFPMYGRCSVPELVGEIRIPPAVYIPKTKIEELGISSVSVVEVQFADIDQSLNGSIRATFLVDSEGKPELCTPEARWVEAGATGGQGYESQRSNLIVNGSYHDVYSGRFGNAICIDGIRVAGDGRRSQDPRFEGMLGGPGNPIHCGDLFRFLLDIRGSMKPPLTPARTPPEYLRSVMSENPQWDRIQQFVHKAEGLLFEKLVEKFGREVDLDIFWPLACIYGGQSVSAYWMPGGTLWATIGIPIGYEDGHYEWQKLASLPTLEFITPLSTDEKESRPMRQGSQKDKNSHAVLRQPDGGIVGECSQLLRWNKERREPVWGFTLLVALMSTVVLSEQGPRLELRRPEEPESAPAESIIGSDINWFMLLPYSGDLRGFLSVHLPISSANRYHPLSKVVFESRWLEQRNGLQEFARELVSRLSRGGGFDHRSYQHWQKKIGHLYRGIDWGTIVPELHPPYKILTSAGAVELVTEEILERWADTPVAAME